MIDHVLGRPSSKFRKVQVFAVVSFWSLYLLRGNNHGPPLIRSVSQRLSRKFTPFQSVVITLLYLYLCRNFAKLVGLESPEPLANLYSRSYFRATWITTALDAGFWSAMRIRNRRVRDLASILFTMYYLIAAEQADEKVRKVRAVLTVDHLRVSWNKPTTPYLYALTSMLRPKFTKYGPRKIRIPRPKHSAYKEPVNGWMYFDGPLSELQYQSKIVLDIPGGGFVAMDPRASDDKLLAWAGRTGLPILSLDYKKAPEYPYPYALNECFDVYTQIIATKGRCIGMKPPHCPRIVVTGDSAGGNLATGTTLMIIQSNQSSTSRGILPTPAGLVLLYPALDMNIGSWMTDDQMALIRNPHTRTDRTELSGFIKRKSEDIDQRYTPTTPRPLDSEDEDLNPFDIELVSASTKPLDRADTIEESQKTLATTKPQPLRTRLAVASIISYFNDRILSPEILRTLIILYIGPHARPDFTTDYLLCPAVAPESLLAKFPKTYFLTGERDPLVDDTVIFAGRLRGAKEAIWRERQEVGLEKSSRKFVEKEHVEVSLIKGVSHGFIQFVSVYPEGWKHIHRCGGWIVDLFERPPHSMEGPAIERRLRQGRGSVEGTGERLDLATSSLGKKHKRTATGGSVATEGEGATTEEEEDAPLAMTTIRPVTSPSGASGASKAKANGHVTTGSGGSGSTSPEQPRKPSRSKSLLSLGSEEDLLKRRMGGLTRGLMGEDEDPLL